MVIERGKLRHNISEHEDDQRRDQHHEHARINERGDELLAEGERDALETDVALQHFEQVARALAGQQGGGVHDWKAALRLECRGKRLAGFDAG